MAVPDARAAVAALADRTATLADLREIVTRFPELRPVVAAYPDTDDALLSWLRDLQDPGVDAQLAKRAASGQAPTPVPTAPEAVAPLTNTPAVYPPQTPEPVSFQPVASTPAIYPSGGQEPIRYPPVTYGTITYPTAPTDPTYTSASATTPAGGMHTPAQETEPQRRRSVLPLVLTIVAALVVVGGGIGAAFAAGLIGGNTQAPSASTRPRETPGTGVSMSPGRTASSTAAASAPPSAGGSATPAATGTTCWDGKEVTDVSACDRPSSKDAYWSYLKYVYPSIATHPDCVHADSTGKSTYTGVTVMWECELGDALIRYRYWQSTKDARAHYAAKFNAKSLLKTYDLLVGGEPVHGWAKTDKDTVKGPGGVKRVVVTVFLPDQNLSLTVQGNTTESMWAAFDQVRIRPLTQALGSPSGSAAVEAPLTARAR